MNIQNLYRRMEIFECFCLEKIHGTSASITYRDGKLTFFSGGEKHENFIKLFNNRNLEDKFAEMNRDNVVIYGEAFGGKCQGMSKTYGPNLRFMAFDVKIGDTWLDVPSAEGVVKDLGLDFVPYERGPLTLDWLNSQRDRPSLVAIVPDAIREGVVIRPIHEATFNNGERWIIKHKRDEFRETKTVRELDPNKLVLLSEATAVADEWVTPMRLTHILDKNPYMGPHDTNRIIKAMIEDVKREGVDEIVWSREVSSAIGRRTAMFLQELKI